MPIRRCYTTSQVCAALEMSRSTFSDLRRAGKLPFLEELKPRIGKSRRYRADLIDRYLENRFRDSMRVVSVEP